MYHIGMNDQASVAGLRRDLVQIDDLYTRLGSTPRAKRWGWAWVDNSLALPDGQGLPPGPIRIRFSGR